MNELALFSGAGGGILGGKLLGWRTRCAVELDAYFRRSLLARQRDGSLHPFPIWDDVCTFDGKPWRGSIDIVTGGFPCQDISAAGKGAGITGDRSGLWKEFARIIREVGPRYVLVENSPVLTSRGLGVVLGDLASMGYDARWGVISTADAIWSLGPPCLDHLRERIWVVATYTNGEHVDGSGHGTVEVCGQLGRPPQLSGRQEDANTAQERWGERWEGRSDSSSARQSEQALDADANANGAGCSRQDASQPEGWECDSQPVGGVSQASDASGGRRGESEGREVQQSGRAEVERAGEADGYSHEVERQWWARSFREPYWWGQSPHASWWQSEPSVGRVVSRLANKLERIGAVGNGQTPAVVRLAWNILSQP